MKEIFIKETKIIDKTEKEQKESLRRELENSRKRLLAYYTNIDMVENNLIDYYAYQIKAEKAKFGYLLEKIRVSK